MKILRRWCGVFSCVSLGILTSNLEAAPILDLDAYLSQVKRNNPGIQGALISSQAGMERTHEGELLLSYRAFINSSYTRDAKLNPPLLILYDAQEQRSLNLGISKLTTFGLEAKLFYDVSTFNYVNPSISPAFSSMAGLGGGPSPFPLSIANSSPVLELTQSFWSNGFGRSTRANQEMIQARALMSSYGSRFQAKNDLTQAEATYWRLAAARQIIQVQKEALDRANRLYDWNIRRSKLHLNDQSDVLQSEALVQGRKFELASASNDERSAARLFNRSRNLDSLHVEEELSPIDPEQVLRLQPPERAELRDDVKAAREDVRVNTSNVDILIEQNLPKFNVFAKLALNGQKGNQIFGSLSDAIPASLSLNRPTAVVGINFSAPLDFKLLGSVQESWKKEKMAAELRYDQKLLEQDQSWKNLSELLNDSQNNLSLSLKLEQIQLAKLDNERDRLQKGRTTTSQVLLFEQDYLVAQLSRIRSQAQVLTVLAQMKLFGDQL